MRVDVYRSARERISDVVAGLTDEQLATVVPATPKWTVRDLFTHLVAVADALSTRPADAPLLVIPPPDAVTAVGVDQRRGQPTADVLAEWDKAGLILEERLPGWGRWSAPVHDLLCHEADIRGALELPRVPDEGWQASLDEFASFLVEFEPVLSRRWRLPDTGTVVVQAGDRSYVLGAGDPSASVTVPEPYELWRAMFGRRSRRQMAAWQWSTDPQPYLDDLPFFDTTTEDLTEP
jgi:uncharacterized protein (TIGR03083 family)